ncbi:glucan biosynthesis protein G [Vineibacter terrae]|uniref:glucan biosynthesis protein n=1 Tax=Vineibacter terrae TaxID=2586908 RepID=UPI002E3743A8|nr:glucan biosynthesis protein G [Vineibacter terrae]HEX2884922.1 glucan biosynthesis protein G [Vineibacter terrae]
MGNSQAMGRCTRRDLTIGALVAAALGPAAAARAQLPAPAGQIPAPPPAAFDYDVVIEEARRLAMAPYQAPAPAALPAEWRDLTYDRYQQIRFRPAASLWSDRKAFFRAQFFAAGFIYSTPVAINIVTDGVANPFVASRDLFNWNDVKLKEPPPEQVPLAGFRLHYPLHGPEPVDEIAAFIGASYFRLLGRNQVYGISARGLAIDTGLQRQEEFPAFRAFWLETPAPEAREITFHALLDSPALAGAYKFTLRPGTETRLEVTATLFTRHGVGLLGVAPLTSMFLAGKNSDRRQPGDFRPEVHDSDGLLIETGQREWLWRPLSNSADLDIASFGDKNPRGFGLIQRDRTFDHYQDLQALYHRRPSLWVEPVGDWGEGEVRLIEIPADSEIHDNVVAFWVGREPVKAGQRLELKYRLHSFAEAARFPPGGRAIATRVGVSDLFGTGKPSKTARRVVVDFAGGELENLRPEHPVSAQVSVTVGKLLDAQLQPIIPSKAWRLVADIEPDGKKPIEMRAFLRLYDEALTETWTYRWRP